MRNQPWRWGVFFGGCGFSGFGSSCLVFLFLRWAKNAFMEDFTASFFFGGGWKSRSAELTLIHLVTSFVQHLCSRVELALLSYGWVQWKIAASPFECALRILFLSLVALSISALPDQWIYTGSGASSIWPACENGDIKPGIPRTPHQP